MKIETLRRGLNKDECFCGSDKDIKNIRCLFFLKKLDDLFGEEN